MASKPEKQSSSTDQFEKAAVKTKCKASKALLELSQGIQALKADLYEAQIDLAAQGQENDKFLGGVEDELNRQINAVEHLENALFHETDSELDHTNYIKKIEEAQKAFKTHSDEAEKVTKAIKSCGDIAAVINQHNSAASGPPQTDSKLGQAILKGGKAAARLTRP